MEKTRLFLTKKDKGFYVINLYETPNENPEKNFKESPKLEINFPYFNGERERALEKARFFGNLLAKNLNTILEEDPNSENVG